SQGLARAQRHAGFLAFLIGMSCSTVLRPCAMVLIAFEFDVFSHLRALAVFLSSRPRSDGSVRHEVRGIEGGVRPSRHIVAAVG
ncbi:MAG: hypothetical protein LC749_13090, partial [Actinobacteria bacterium]|nr:hypothetical protein [Actinomycetota bacterium]